MTPGLWSSLRQALRAGRGLRLFCDYDGTLVPLRDRPAQARLPDRTRRCLARLAGHPGVFLAIISGRALRDLKRMVGLHGVCYAGNHGLELEGPRLRYRHPAAERYRPRMARLAAALEAAVRPIPGAWVEAKGLTLSLHWREVPLRLRGPLRRAAGAVLTTLRRRGAVRVTRGQYVTDVRPPVDWDKGKIVLWLLRRARRARGGHPALVIYLGDDRTDEDAFAAVNRLGGVSVLVGRSRRRTSATHRLRGPREVWRGFAACAP